MILYRSQGIAKLKVLHKWENFSAKEYKDAYSIDSIFLLNIEGINWGASAPTKWSLIGTP